MGLFENEKLLGSIISEAESEYYLLESLFLDYSNNLSYALREQAVFLVFNV